MNSITKQTMKGTIMPKARNRTKILGLWWNGSREKVLELLSEAKSKNDFGVVTTCPLCKDARISNLFSSCTECILPGYGRKRCLRLHKIMKRSTISKHLKEFPLSIIDNEIYFHINENFEINNSIEKLISFIKEEQDENSSKS